MIEIEHEPRQLVVGAVLVLVTAIIQTFGVVFPEEVVGFRDRAEPAITRTRMLSIHAA